MREVLGEGADIYYPGYLAGWYGIMERDAIKYALETACLYGADNPVGYANTVLGEWYGNGITTEDAARAWREAQEA